MKILLSNTHVFGLYLKPRHLASTGSRRKRDRIYRRLAFLNGQPSSELGWQSFENASKEGGDLQLGTLVGTGSYGIVREANYKGLKVAVKVLTKKRGTQARGKVLRKLAREIDLLTRLQDCGSVVQLITVLEDEEHAYLVCELCRGGDLEKILTERGPFTERAAARVVYETLKTVAACHSRGLIHGDVKPANFLLRQPFRDPNAYLDSGSLKGAWLKCIDFGCSQIVPKGERLSRRTGTPVYMAPEIFERRYGLEADIWSVGIMFYQLMSSRFPFWSSLEECRNKTINEVMYTVLHSSIPLDYGPWLSMSPEGLDLMSRLTHRVPALRITAAQALNHAWFKTQLSAAPPSPKQSQQSNIIPRLGKLKAAQAPVHVGGRQNDEESVPSKQKQTSQPQQRKGNEEGNQDSKKNAQSSTVWKPYYGPVLSLT